MLRRLIVVEFEMFVIVTPDGIQAATRPSFHNLMPAHLRLLLEVYNHMVVFRSVTFTIGGGFRGETDFGKVIYDTL